MTALPTWSILVPTIPRRAALFERLLDVLLPQLDELAGRVRVIAWRNSGEPRLAEVRDALVDDAPGEYVSFIDDDDLVPDYFVAEVARALEQRPDHVGFRLSYEPLNEREHEVVEHSVIYSRAQGSRGWGRCRDGILYRDLTHVDPIRREIAARGRFAEARPHRAEDRVWVRQVRPLVETEAYVDKIMYRYLYDPDESSWGGVDRWLGPVPPRIEPASPYFTWHPRSDS